MLFVFVIQGKTSHIPCMGTWEPPLPCAVYVLSDYLGIDQVDDDENLTPYTRDLVQILHIGHTKYILGMVIDQHQSPPSLSSIQNPDKISIQSSVLSL